jgi:hypothetical protein
MSSDNGVQNTDKFSSKNIYLTYVLTYLIAYLIT